MTDLIVGAAIMLIGVFAGASITYRPNDKENEK